MNESVLLSTLGKKYGIDIDEDYKVMELFNRLCLSVEADDKFHRQVIITEEERIKYIKIIEERNKKINTYEKVLLEMLTGEALSQIVKAKVKKVCEKNAISITVKDGIPNLLVDGS